jgi:RNA polymerase sigma factor (sigma-70 family)
MDESLSIPVQMSETNKTNIADTFKLYSRWLLNFIKKRVPDTADAEDILQDVFYQFAGNTKPIEQLTAWLFTTARNKITDSYRKKKAESLDSIFAGEEDEAAWWDQLLFDSNTPEDDYLKNIFWTTLQGALDELPPEQREAFVWHELEDVSFSDMAEITQVPVATLISRKRYAVLHLRKRLQTLKNEILNY